MNEQDMLEKHSSNFNKQWILINKNQKFVCNNLENKVR